MDSQINQTPPQWLKEPKRFLETLEHSLFHTAEFNSMVNMEDTSKFAAGIRSFMYWRRQLIPSLTSLTVSFALIGANGLMPLNVINVISGALKVYCLKKAVEFSQGANSQFLAVSFSSAEDAEGFKKAFKYFGDAVIGYVKPASSEAYRYSLLWLPPLFKMERVHGLLNRYCNDFTTVKGSIAIGEGQYMPSSVVRGTLTLKHGVDIEDLPHLVPLPSPHLGYALLIVDGRKPFCLKCLRKGHLRKHCDRPKCKKCHFYHSSSEVCDHSSYAAKVSRTPGAVQSYCWVDDVTMPEETIVESTEPPTEAENADTSQPVAPIRATTASVLHSTLLGNISADCSSENISTHSIISPSITEVGNFGSGACAQKSTSTSSNAIANADISTASDESTTADSSRDDVLHIAEEDSDNHNCLSDVSVVLRNDHTGNESIGEIYSDSSADENIIGSSPDGGGGGKRLKMEKTNPVNVDFDVSDAEVINHRRLRSAESQDLAEAAHPVSKRQHRRKPAKSAVPPNT